MAQMKEQIKTAEKELNVKGIANLSDPEFKTVVIRMLTEMTEFSHKIRKEMKVIQSEINKIFREPTVKGRKPGLKSMIWRGKKK